MLLACLTCYYRALVPVPLFSFSSIFFLPSLLMNIVVFHSSSCRLMYLHVLQSCFVAFHSFFTQRSHSLHLNCLFYQCYPWPLIFETSHKKTFLWHSSAHCLCQCYFFCNISATLLFYFRNISSQKSSLIEDGKIDGSPTTNISCNDFTAEAKPSVAVVSPMCIKSISSSLAPRQHAKPNIGVVFPLILLLNYHENYPKGIIWANVM